MKIRENVNKHSEIKEVSGKDGVKVAHSKGASFQNHLHKMEGKDFQQKIHNLANKIIEQGEKFSKRIDVRELKVYKSMISEFLNEVVSNSHKFSKENSLDRRGRYKVFAMVKKVNEELDELTKEVLSTEKDNLAILRKIEDIRGLIIDLTL